VFPQNDCLGYSTATMIGSPKNLTVSCGPTSVNGASLSARSKLTRQDRIGRGGWAVTQRVQADGSSLSGFWGTSRGDISKNPCEREVINICAGSCAPSPRTLPVMESSELELVVNANTTRMLGITVPQSLLANAGEVIE